MKKLLIFSWILFISFSAHAQLIPLGERLDTVVAKLETNKTEFTLDRSYGFPIIMVKTVPATRIYGFTDTNICDSVTIIPHSDELFKDLAKSLGVKKNKPIVQMIEFDTFNADVRISINYPSPDLPTIVYQLLDF